MLPGGKRAAQEVLDASRLLEVIRVGSGPTADDHRRQFTFGRGADRRLSARLDGAGIDVSVLLRHSSAPVFARRCHSLLRATRLGARARARRPMVALRCDPRDPAAPRLLREARKSRAARLFDNVYRVLPEDDAVQGVSARCTSSTCPCYSTAASSSLQIRRFCRPDCFEVRATIRGLRIACNLGWP